MSREGRWGCRARRGASRRNLSPPISHTPAALRGGPVRSPPSPPMCVSAGTRGTDEAPRRAGAPPRAHVSAARAAGGRARAGAHTKHGVGRPSHPRYYFIDYLRALCAGQPHGGQVPRLQRCGERMLTTSRGGNLFTTGPSGHEGGLPLQNSGVAANRLGGRMYGPLLRVCPGNAVIGLTSRTLLHRFTFGGSGGCGKDVLHEVARGSAPRLSTRDHRCRRRHRGEDWAAAW